MNAVTHGDRFFRVDKVTRATSQGDVEFPIAYYDTDNLIAMFSVDEAPIRERLAGTGLELVRLGGRACIALVFFEYRDTSIGPYNEVGVATLAVPTGTAPPTSTLLDVLRNPRKRRAGFYIFDLPVTTAIACAAGREMWGYPKFVTPIPIRFEGRSFDGRVLDPDDGSTIVRLAGTPGPGVPMGAIDLMIYSQLDDTRLRAHVDARGGARASIGGSLTATVEASRHPMAENLRAFGLDGRTPALAVWSKRGRSLLYLGDPY